MKRILSLLIFFGLLHYAQAQHYEIPTTPFSRTLLAAPDSTTAKGILGVSGGGSTWTPSGSDIWFGNNVGIGTTPPDSGSRPDMTLFLHRDAFANAYIDSSDDYSGTQFCFQQPDYNFVFGMRGDGYYGTAPGDFFLHSDNGGTTPLICTPDGRVGFGGYEPSAAVQFVTADDTDPGNIWTWDNRHVVYGLQGGNGGGLGISYSSAQSAVWSFYLIPGIAFQNARFLAANYIWQCAGTSTSILRCVEDSVGSQPRVGINTDTPSSSYILDVNGAVHHSGALTSDGNPTFNGSSSSAQIKLGPIYIYTGTTDPPTVAAPNGSLYLVSGTTGKLYLRTGGAWVQK